jgi:hypothetical protein
MALSGWFTKTKQYFEPPEISYYHGIVVDENIKTGYANKKIG